MPAKTPFAWSPSHLGRYRRCPRSEQWHSEGVAPQPNPMLMLGQVFHDLVRQVHQVPPRSQRPTFFKEWKSCQQAWWSQRFWGSAKPMESWWEGRDPWTDHGKLGAQAIKVYWDKITQAHSTPLAVERSFRGYEFKLGGYYYRGVIDQVWRTRDGRLAIVDLKLSGANPEQEAWQDWLRKNLQLTLYWQAAQTIWPHEEIALFVHHFWIHWVTEPDGSRHQVVTSHFYPTQRQPEDLKAALEVIEFVATNIQDGYFPPTEDRNTCRWCEYAYHCQEGRLVRSQPLEALDYAPELVETAPLITPKPRQRRFKFRVVTAH